MKTAVPGSACCRLRASAVGPNDRELGSERPSRLVSTLENPDRWRIPASSRRLHPACGLPTSRSTHRIGLGRSISAIAARPPGRSTRASSASPRSASAQWCTVSEAVARSNDASSKGRDSAEATRKETGASPRLARAWATIRGAGSTPIARAERRARAIVSVPVPHPTSRTRRPSTGPRASIRASCTGSNTRRWRKDRS
jgi:hypothetical protein